MTNRSVFDKKVFIVFQIENDRALHTFRTRSLIFLCYRLFLGKTLPKMLQKREKRSKSRKTFRPIHLVRITGLEPAQPCDHKNLNLTRLPIPPYPRAFVGKLYINKNRSVSQLLSQFLCKQDFVEKRHTRLLLIFVVFFA